uniref:Putative reverse transcriptase domain-containing protein n=1 Tax=Tanacetum cinerariifolium TaxID=118510 RepID=A0A699HCF6_TANCI|nr:putative reverse transcriptase domain-containing protein [Tanacetum cinerariifolium]
MLKVSPWKGVVCFGKRGKLNPIYIGPSKVLAKVGTVSYRLELPQQLSRVHSTFHVSNLKKCLSDEPLAISLDEVHIDDKLCFVEELVEVMDREVKRLKQSRIPIIKFRWNSKRGPEFTWERELGFGRISVVKGNRETAVKASAGCIWRSKRHYWNKVSKYNSGSKSKKYDNPHQTLKGKGFVDSGCSRNMTENKAYLVEYQDFIGGPVAFGGTKGQITSKGKIRTGKLNFEDVYFVKELQHFNLFSVSQMCDKKNKVLFTDTDCLVLSPNFKLPNENQVLLRVPRQNNMYNFNLENIVPFRGLACLIAKVTVDESNKWHRRMTTPVLLVIKESNTRPPPVTTENKASKTTGRQEANNIAGTQDTIHAGAARASSTNYVNTVSTPINTTSTPVNIASTPVNTASPSRNVSVDGPSYPDLSTSANQDYSQIHSLEYIYEVPNDGIFTSASYDDEGAVADFTNLESIVNVSPILQSKIHSIHHITQILRDPTSAVQTRSKVNKRRAVTIQDSISLDSGYLPFGKKDKQKDDGIFINQDKYVAEILKKFDFMSVKTASTPITSFYLKEELLKDQEAFVCACSRFQVTPKTSHLNDVKRIFRYLKGQSTSGLWYPRESASDLEAYSDSDYVGANLDRKSTTRGC